MSERLEQAEKMERRLIEYYKRAVQEARTPEIRRVMDSVMAHHTTHRERLHALHETLQREEKKSTIVEALESIGEAISGVLAGLPVELIEEETDPSIPLMIDMEEGMTAFYNELAAVEDDRIKTMALSAAADGRLHVNRLKELDTLA